MPVAVDTDTLHPATTLCLEAMQWLDERYDFHRILDMGCGNGLLSLVSAGMWDAEVVAVDISPNAVADTRNNSRTYGLDEAVTVLRSDGFRDAGIKRRGPYDLILFNLLAEPIVEMAPDVSAHLAPGGVCIIGGLFQWKADTAREVYTGLGFEILHTLQRSPWRTIILRKANSAM